MNDRMDDYNSTVEPGATVYADQNPLSFSDPYGLFKIGPLCWILGATILDGFIIARAKLDACVFCPMGSKKKWIDELMNLEINCTTGGGNGCANNPGVTAFRAWSADRGSYSELSRNLNKVNVDLLQCGLDRSACPWARLLVHEARHNASPFEPELETSLWAASCATCP